MVTPSRAVNFANLLETARKRVLTLTERLPSFPSLIISADGLEPQGDFAIAQAQYLKPDSAQVDRLVKVRTNSMTSQQAINGVIDPLQGHAQPALPSGWSSKACLDTVFSRNQHAFRRVYPEGLCGMLQICVAFLNPGV